MTQSSNGSKVPALSKAEGGAEVYSFQEHILSSARRKVIDVLISRHGQETPLSEIVTVTGLSPDALFPAVCELEDRGLVVSRWDGSYPRRRVYRLETTKGGR